VTLRIRATKHSKAHDTTTRRHNSCRVSYTVITSKNGSGLQLWFGYLYCSIILVCFVAKALKIRKPDYDMCLFGLIREKVMRFILGPADTLKKYAILSR
jgi:hypothetical protein